MSAATDDVQLPSDIGRRAAELDASDQLAEYRTRFVDTPEVRAYLDGNSLGRPLKATETRLREFVNEVWGGRLIRAWDEQWMETPTTLGDAIGRITLGAGTGTTVVGDSTTVMLYKLVRAAVAARSGRSEIVADTQNFPTDRFILQGVAAECGLTIRWIDPDPKAGVTAEQVSEFVGPQTALVLLSHVAFRSGFIADLAAITRLAHESGSLVLWDLSHSVGVVELALDESEVDLAVGCTYKYLNGGPGSPAFGYVSAAVVDQIRQPIQGWMGAADPFEMKPLYAPAHGIRGIVSGTPPIIGMLAMQDMLALIEAAGMRAIRAKSVALTEFAVELSDQLLADHGAQLSSPRDPAVRGGHVTLDHPDFKPVTAELWKRGVIPDFRPPTGIRVGLSPLSTSFTEVAIGIVAIAAALTDH